MQVDPNVYSGEGYGLIVAVLLVVGVPLIILRKEIAKLPWFPSGNKNNEPKEPSDGSME